MGHKKNSTISEQMRTSAGPEDKESLTYNNRKRVSGEAKLTTPDNPSRVLAKLCDHTSVRSVLPTFPEKLRQLRSGVKGVKHSTAALQLGMPGL